MMKFLKVLAGLSAAALMAACGGGGGSAGTTGNGTGGGTIGGGTTQQPTLALSIVTASGVSTSTVSTATTTFARAVVKDAAGSNVSGAVVTFSGGNGLVTFAPTNGTALTDANGVAQVQILPASATAAGAASLTASSTVATTPVSASLTFQVPSVVSAEPTARVTNYYVTLDRNTLVNSTNATAKLSVTAVDANNNVVPGAAVSVTTDNNSVFTPASTTTDASGLFTGQIGYGGDKSDRTIKATITINGIVKNVTIPVTGSKLTLQSTPSTPSPGQAATATATLVDAGGNAIAGSTVTFGGTVAALQGRTAVTNATGVATVSYNAPSAAGAYTISASANGVLSGDYQLQVFSSTVPAATIPSNAVASLSANPNVLAVNTAGTSTNRSTLRFQFLDASNTPITNVRVRFQDVTTGLPLVGASILSGNTTLYTDASGSVTTQYISGPNSSPTNGVKVRACYKATDFTSNSDCPAFVDQTLTVAGQALAISIGDDNVLSKGPGTYTKNFTVTVADSAGRAVANAPVDISVDLTHFGKGTFSAPIPLVPLSLEQGSPVDLTTVPTAEFRVWCPNEDRDRNGSVSGNENRNGSTDTNGQPTLEPRKSDLLISYADPAVTTTNASGVLVIKVEYSQRFATWLAYTLRVTANVAGSQGMAERSFVTDFAIPDASNGSFLTPPYGVMSCTSPG